MINGQLLEAIVKRSGCGELRLNGGDTVAFQADSLAAGHRHIHATAAALARDRLRCELRVAIHEPDGMCLLTVHPDGRVDTLPTAPAHTTANRDGAAHGIVIEEEEPDPPPATPHPATGALVGVIATGRLEDSATVALLLALHAAALGKRALCADAAGPLGQLGHLAQAATGYTLAQAANLAARDAIGSRELVARAPGEISMIAAGEHHASLQEEAPAPNAVKDLLAQARCVYALTAVDCGTAATPAALDVCPQATHLIWVIRASPSDLHAAHRALRRLHGHPHARETIVARACHPSEGRVRPRRLAALAAERHAAEVVMLPDEQLALPDDRERLLQRYRLQLHQLTARIGVV